MGNPRTFLILLAMISVVGCVSNYSSTAVRPSEAAKVLRPGDEVVITLEDDSVLNLRVKEIDEAEVSGSDQASMFGRVKNTIPISDIRSISLSNKDEGYDAEQTLEAWSYLLILWPFFVF